MNGDGGTPGGGVPTGWGTLPLPPDVVDGERFRRAVSEIDTANAEDPNVLAGPEGPGPKELVHARMMTAWLRRLDATAGEAQHLAARGHHFRRWTLPRSEFPEGRSGYLQWRTAAKRRHAEQVSELLGRLGYDAAVVERVSRIIRKQGLGTDAAVQHHEDALCLVFLQTQLLDVADRLGEPEIVEVLARTLPKLSPAGLETATSLDLGPRGTELLVRAAGRAG